MIIKCTCYHPAQDKLQGKGRRVHNAMTRTSGGKKFRCTVCGNERDSSFDIFPSTPVEQPKNGGAK